jgi:pimeloyl-ACP methyl ester carboxylesterase
VTGSGKALRYLVYAPPTPSLKPPLVLLHGNSRSPQRLFGEFLPLATRYGFPLIAPRFPKAQFPAYQRLASADDAWGAMRALDATLDDAGTTLGLSTDLIDLVGFSGGAQFAHRYAMVSPQRVVHVVPVAAGWYTRLDPVQTFPRGTATMSPEFPVMHEPFISLPIRVIVGGADTQVDESVRTSAWLSRTQGDHRLERAHRWVEHVHERAVELGVEPRIELEVAPGADHSLTSMFTTGTLGERVMSFTHPLDVALDAAGWPTRPAAAWRRP